VHFPSAAVPNRVRKTASGDLSQKTGKSNRDLRQGGICQQRGIKARQNFRARALFFAGVDEE
jgi:hypothetical protein